MTFVKTTRKNKSHWFYQLLMALPISLAVAFGLSLWQSGGEMLFNKNLSSETAKSDFSWFNFEGLIPTAYAQACTGDPTPPPSGAGAIYYNSCAPEFRMYVGGKWERINLWKQSADLSQTYLANIGSKVGVGTQTPSSWLHIDAGTGLNYSNREPIQFTVTTGTITGTSTANITAVIKSNVSEFGVWYDTGNVTTSRWADIIASKLTGTIITGTQFCLPDDSDLDTAAECISTWPSSTFGDGYWNYEIPGDTSSPLVNLNSYNGVPGNPGIVKVDDTLYVLNTLYVKNVPRAGGPWLSDIQTGEPPTIPMPENLNCDGSGGIATVNCKISEIFIIPDNTQATKVKIALGKGGMLLRSTGEQQWTSLAEMPGASAPDFQSLWAKDSNTIYAINLGDTTGLWEFVGGAWADPCNISDCNGSSNASTASYSHVWSWPGQNIIYFTGTADRYVRYFSNSTKTFSQLGGSNAPSNLALISGDNANRIFIANNSLSSGNDVKYLTRLQLTAPGSTSTISPGNKTNISITGDLGYALDPKVLAVDYFGSCGNSCVVMLGSYDNSQVQPKTSILIGDGGSTPTNWNAYTTNGLKAANDNNPQPNYNDGTTTWNSAWVGQNGNMIILSGTRSGVNFILMSQDKGVTWIRNKPDDDGYVCNEVACPPYAVAGTTSKFYTAHFYNRIFAKTISSDGSSGGYLEVAGDAKVAGNIWGTSAGGNAGANPGDGLISPISANNSSCPPGEFVVGVRKTGTEVTGLYCQKL